MAIQHIVQLKSYVFWNITPCSPLKVSWHCRGSPVDFPKTTQSYIPKDRTHNYCCENIESYILKLLYAVYLIEYIWVVGLVMVDQEVGSLSLLTSHHWIFYGELNGIVHQDVPTTLENVWQCIDDCCHESPSNFEWSR
jgi:hypothetical protein